MATKRKRSKEQNKVVETTTDAAKPEASGRISPRKRTDVPAKAKAPMATKAKGRAGSAARACDADEAAASSAESSREQRRRQRADAKPRKRHWPAAVAGTVLLIIFLAVGIFSWDRWLRYDDALEFQGEWQTHGTTAVVVIDGETIKLTEDVAWSYTLDTRAKTLSFTFGNMEGSGRYRFSLDRSQLTIFDGGGYTWVSTLVEDIGWQFDQLVHAIQGQSQTEPPAGDGITVLDRLSHDTAATPQMGTPVEPEPEPAPEPEPIESETTPESTDGNSDANAGDNKEANAGDAKDDADASGTPGGVFDVSDLPA